MAEARPVRWEPRSFISPTPTTFPCKFRTSAIAAARAGSAKSVPERCDCDVHILFILGYGFALPERRALARAWRAISAEFLAQCRRRLGLAARRIEAAGERR